MDAAMLLSCIEQCQAFVVLATNTLKAEFPDTDVLTCFRVFDVVKKRGVQRDEGAHCMFKERSLKRLAQVLKLDFDVLKLQFDEVEPVALYEASIGRTTSFESWRTAILRVKSRRRDKNVLHHLLQAVTAYAAWNGLASSGVEQNFSTLAEGLLKQRRHMSLNCKTDIAFTSVFESLLIV